MACKESEATRVRDFGATLIGIVVLGLQVFLLASATGVVKEHCLAGNAQDIQDVESGWTYILWPPLVFTALDPAGRCVRNTIAREALGKAGIWPLGSPAEQVKSHLRRQAEREGSEDLITLIEPGTGEPESEKQLLLEKFRVLIRRLGYPAAVERCVMHAARRIPADRLYNETRGELNQTRVSAAMDKAWARCLPEGAPMINPDASDEAIEMNRWLVAAAVAENLREAGAPQDAIKCVEEAIDAIGREELIELSTDQDQFAAHVDSLVHGCSERR